MVSHNFWLKKCLAKIIWVIIKTFPSEDFLAKKIFWLKKMFVNKYLWSKNLQVKNSRSKNIFGKKIFVQKNFLKQKKIWGGEILVKNDSFKRILIKKFVFQKNFD